MFTGVSLASDIGGHYSSVSASLAYVTAIAVGAIAAVVSFLV